MKQHTLKQPASLEGKSLHTGENVRLTLRPAPENHGIVFRRTDLPGCPSLPARIEQVSELVRSTSLTHHGVTVHTVEHVLSALSGSQVHNAWVDLDASEPPILDGSARGFVELIETAGRAPQEASVPVYALKEPICITEGNRSLVALPYDGLKITCTSFDDRGSHTQHLSLEPTPLVFAKEIAPARTFVVYEDIELLLQMGKIRGGSLESAIVIKGNKIMAQEPLRFKDEFVRHKILDILGDLSLLGVALKMHLIAVCPSHALNARLTRAIAQKMAEPVSRPPASSALNAPEFAVSPPPKTPQPALSSALEIGEILKLLPHRYPFVMVDRVLEVHGEDRLIALKNVSINEPYFQGHFPGKPIMPGVLQVEAMAQAAGLLMLRRVSSENKLTFFMSCDQVKFRKVVQPGDQLIIEVVLKNLRAGRIATAEGVCRVGEQIVSSAQMMFTLVDAPPN